MQPILLVGHPLGSSLGLVVALEWLGQSYRAARVAMPDDMRTPVFARVNGRRETPVLIRPDGQPLTEAMAIALWIEEQDEERRLSFARGSRQAHRLHQVMAFVNASFTPVFSPLWVALEARDLAENERETLRTLGRNMVIKRHAQLEDMLGDAAFLVGDKPTLADAMFIGVARWAEFHQAIDPGQYPRLQALKRRLEADPAVAFAHMLEDGTPTAESRAFAGIIPLADALAAAMPG